ncbi:hypothetical protein ES319_D03G019200v1 [Gossypium barbadense]|uniref:Synechocystis YCF37 n=1 Tax=Gossypium barbadense TaxID=3634 RepID=A0A5J5S6Q3_GOSBA|nr:hypothetical protein ES319_D03G019200v1 [Gossypium barbadense]PPD69335.1 hypothetical protein GOBAR_DD33788 [Gossypium barbadense]
MAFTISPPVLHSLSVRRVRDALPGRSVKAQVSKPAPTISLPNRRQLLFFLTATTALTVKDPPSKAEDIPLFGLRKKLKKAEEEAAEIVKEGIQTAENGLETAEIEIKTAEEEIESSVTFGALVQAGAVAGAELLGVVAATSFVNGILGADPQKS